MHIHRSGIKISLARRDEAQKHENWSHNINQLKIYIMYAKKS